MSEPERLLDRPPNDLARTLLRAGREEAPSRRSLQRTLSAVGVGAAALGAAGSAGALGAAKVATQATLITLAKWAGVGAFGGVVVAATAHGLAPRQEVTAPPPASIAHVPAAPPTPAAPQVEAPRAEPVVPVVTAEPVQHRPAPPEPVLAEAEAPLAAEVAFVDRGRAAFQRGELAAALAALASYERDFPEPRLLPEVLYLRMEASSHGGDDARAAALGERILRDFPRSPHAARARALLAARRPRP